MAVAVAVVACAALVLVAVLAAGSNEEQQGLAVERIGAAGGGVSELVVYVQDRSKNDLATTGGQPTVKLECLDKTGRVLVRHEQEWPFGYPDGRDLDPHVHQPLPARNAGRAVRCRLGGTRPLLEGEVGGPAVR